MRILAVQLYGLNLLMTSMAGDLPRCLIRFLTWGTDMTTLTGNEIQRFQIRCLMGAVKLEAKGMTRSRGRSATVIAKEKLGLKKSASREEVLTELERLLNE